MFLKLQRLRDGRFVKIEFVENLFDPFTVGLIVSIIGLILFVKYS